MPWERFQLPPFGEHSQSKQLCLLGGDFCLTLYNFLFSPVFSSSELSQPSHPGTGSGALTRGDGSLARGRELSHQRRTEALQKLRLLLTSDIWATSNHVHPFLVPTLSCCENHMKVRVCNQIPSLPKVIPLWLILSFLSWLKLLLEVSLLLRAQLFPRRGCTGQEASLISEVSSQGLLGSEVIARLPKGLTGPY